MDCLDLTLPSPEENLACDEALLDQAEAKGGSPVLRFWESTEYFVVLGYANRVAEEVNMEACQTRGIPILRRCSGGGTVVQGPGCLNYSVILRIDSTPELESITGANHHVMTRIQTGVGRLVGAPVAVQGHTDLAVRDLKFSGNAQRRRRDWLLFHGTILLDFELSLVAEVLREPPRQPHYRHGRSHAEFVTNLQLDRAQVKRAICTVWDAVDTDRKLPTDRIRSLVATRYSDAKWNFAR